MTALEAGVIFSVTDGVKKPGDAVTLTNFSNKKKRRRKKKDIHLLTWSYEHPSLQC